MSHFYYLLCLDCGEAVDLGKIACLDENNRTISWTLTGFGDLNRGMLDGEPLWKLVERFLILYRVHELRFIPEDFLRRLDPEGVLKYLETADELLQRQVEPEPDVKLESQTVPHQVVHKLKEHLQRSYNL